MKIVKIKVIDKTRAPEDIKALSTKKIGSVYTKTGDVLRGFSLDEEKYYLPNVLGISATDPAFGKATKFFWADMSIVLDAEEGDLELNIDGSFDEIKDAQGNVTDRKFSPENIMDWIKYRFIQKHPRVAHKKEDILGPDGSMIVNDTKYMYYVENQEDIHQKEKDMLDINMKADRMYLELFRKTNEGLNEAKINWIVDLYKGEVDPDETVDARTLKDIEEIKVYLYKKKTKNAQKFINIVGDELLEEKALIMKCISEGVLQRIGNTIVDDQLPIGESLKEAAIFIKNPKNSKFVLTIKEKLKTFA